VLNKVKERLNSLKVPITDNDDSLLNFSIDRVRNHIKTQTNQQEIPTELNEIAIDMVIGEFLFLKKSMGQLDIETIDFSPFAKQVQDGDTNVIFAVEIDGTPESKFNAMIEYLQHKDYDFTKFRRLTW